MSTYIRSPRRVTVHCPVAGCKWVNIYFEDSRKQFTLEKRVLLGLKVHIGVKHRKATTLINGR